MTKNSSGKVMALVLVLALGVSGAVYADTAATPPSDMQQPPGNMQGGGHGSPADQLKSYVTSGVLTQSELDAITAWYEDQETERRAEMEAMKDLTEAERKAQMEAERTEPVSMKQQLLDAGLISSAQAAAIDWTVMERPAGGAAPEGVSSATQKVTPTAEQTGKSTGTAAADKAMTVLLNGVEIKATVSPRIDQNGRTLIELRSVAEALGAEIQWDADTQTVTLTADGETVTIRINQSSYHVNGVQKTMDTAAVIESGRTLVPLRVIAEALGAEVSYDSATKTITITQ